MFKLPKSVLLLSSAISFLFLTGCSVIPVDNKLVSAVVQSGNEIIYNSLAFVVDNHYGASITELKTNNDSSFEFLLKDRIHVSSSAYKENSWNYEITSPNDSALYQDIGNVALFLTGGASSEQAIVCQQSLIKSLPHISSMRTDFYNGDKTKPIFITGAFWLENNTIHIVYKASVASASF